MTVGRSVRLCPREGDTLHTAQTKHIIDRQRAVEMKMQIYERILVRIKTNTGLLFQNRIYFKAKECVKLHFFIETPHILLKKHII
mgnify:CR=1 FL=1